MKLIAALIAFSRSSLAVPCQAYYSSTSSSSFMISSCMFYAITSTTYGGSVMISATSASLTINNSIFSSCMTSNSQAGALYFSGYGIYIYSGCSSDCSCSGTGLANGGHFCHSTSTISQIYQLSMLRCSNVTSGTGRYSFFHGTGTQSVELVNSSSNFAESGSGFLFYYPTSANAKFFNIFNCTNSNCAVTLYFEFCASAVFSHSNLVSNVPTNTANGLVYHSSTYSSYSVVLNYTIFLSNKASYLLSTESSGTLAARNCWIDGSVPALTYGNAVTIAGCTITSQSSFYFRSNAFNSGAVQCVLMREDLNNSLTFTHSDQHTTPSAAILQALVLILAI